MFRKVLKTTTVFFKKATAYYQCFFNILAIVSILFSLNLSTSGIQANNFGAYAQDLIKSVDRLQVSKAVQNTDKVIADQGLDHFIKSIQELLPQARQHVEKKLLIKVPKVTIYVSPNQDLMQKKAKHHHHGLPPQWAAGLAYPHAKEIYVPALPKVKLLPLLQHELVHIALGRSHIPLWVNEGLSVLLGDGLSWERMWTLNEAAIQGGLLRFSQLERRFPASGLPATVAYAQSAHFMSTLRELKGPQNFSNWLQELLKGSSIEDTTILYFEKPLWQLEREWKAGFKQGPLAWLALIFKLDNIWAIAIIFFVIQGRKKLRQRNKQRVSPEKPLEIKVATRFRTVGELKEQNVAIFHLPQTIEKYENQDQP